VLLEALSEDARCGALEGALTQHLLRTYALQLERMRLYRTGASGCWEVTEDGLYQFGHSKDLVRTCLRSRLPLVADADLSGIG
jgi:hypothetical protein